MPCSKPSSRRNGAGSWRILPRAAWARIFVAAMLLGASAWSSAATLVPVVPDAARSGGLGIEPWVLTPGAPNPGQGGLDFQCVLEPGEHAAPGDDSCDGYLFFRLYQGDGLSIANASINGRQCEAEPFYAACPVHVGVGMPVSTRIGLNAGPFARTNPDTVLLVNAQGNFSMDPFDVPLQLQPDANLSIRQPLVVVVPGQSISGRTALVVNNQGPSAAKQLLVIEQLPSFMTASAEPGTGCAFDAINAQLRCQVASLAPGASLRIPLTLEAPLAAATTQFDAALTVNSDAGLTGNVGTIMITGDPVYGVMELDPGTQAPTRIQVSMHDAAGSAPGLPDPGMPLQWSLRLSDGVQVDSVTAAADSTQMTCTYSTGVIECRQPAFGSGQIGSGADASISIELTGSGRQAADLCWQTSTVQDCTSLSLGTDSPAAAPAASAPGR